MDMCYRIARASSIADQKRVERLLHCWYTAFHQHCHVTSSDSVDHCLRLAFGIPHLLLLAYWSIDAGFASLSVSLPRFSASVRVMIAVGWRMLGMESSLLDSLTITDYVMRHLSCFASVTSRMNSVK